MIDLPVAEAALIDLAAAWRGWDHQATADAILAAKTTGWEFGRIAAEAVEQLRKDSPPTALRDAAASPFQRVQHGPGETTYSDGAALARELLRHRRDDLGATA